RCKDKTQAKAGKKPFKLTLLLIGGTLEAGDPPKILVREIFRNRPHPQRLRAQRLLARHREIGHRIE
ncbi:MAG: hypothetical protein IH940_09560, partial [Acidobacteria bacterium]|nr:hypothetical protein [Acidobacteriota bacterium]